MSSAFLNRFTNEVRPKFRDRFGWTVSLSRARAATSGVVALADDSDGVEETTDGITTTRVDRVWFIAKESYSIGFHGETAPQRGDRITDAAGDVWEVLPGGAMPAVESYGGGSEWLIRTKRVTA